MDDYLFAEVNTKGLGMGFKIGKFDGICGMGWYDISVDHVQTPLEGSGGPPGQMAEQVFAFYLGSGAARRASCCWAAWTMPPRRRTSHSWTPFPGKVGYWAVGMDDVTIDGSLGDYGHEPSSTLAPRCWRRRRRTLRPSPRRLARTRRRPSRRSIGSTYKLRDSRARHHHQAGRQRVRPRTKEDHIVNDGGKCLLL